MSDLRDLEAQRASAQSRADFFKYWLISYVCFIFAGLALLLSVALLMGN